MLMLHARLVTLLRLLKLFFDDVLVDMILGYIRFYTVIDRKQALALKLLMKKFAYFPACCCLVGVISF